MTSEVRNGKRKSKPEPKQFRQSVFINHTFDEGTKAAFKEWSAKNAANIGDFIDKLLDDGYSLSVKPDSFNDAIAAYIQPVSDDSENAGYILTGRSRSGGGAIMAAVYRHYAVFEGRWPTDHTSKSRLDDE